MIEILLVVLTVLNIGAVILIYKLLNKKVPTQEVSVDLAPVYNLLGQHERRLTSEMKGIPETVLTSISNSSNTHKGKLGELIGYLSLKAEYDRIIPLGSIVDFMCISFPKDGRPGRLVFIDVKTGKSARLSPDQRILKKLIQDKSIEFMKLDVESIDVLGVNDEGTSTDRELS
jgi:predicted Holliday junction resolvase-like endonuclease